MKAVKFLLLAVLVSSAAFLSSCSKSADSLYPAVVDLADKDTLTEAEVAEGVDLLCDFYEVITPEAVEVVKKTHSINDLNQWLREMGEKYPAVDKLHYKLAGSKLTAEQKEKLNKANEAFGAAIDEVLNDK